MLIFEKIRNDHDIQRNLLDKLVKTSGDSPERKSLFWQVRKELQVHADAEERNFYVPLIQDDMTQDKARHGIAEHQEIEELIEKLAETELSSPGWLVYAKQLKETVEHHLDDAEHTFFQMAGKVMSERQKSALAESYERAMEKGRKE